MIGSGTTYNLNPEIDYKVTINGEASPEANIKLGSLVKIEFQSVMGRTDFYIDNFKATEYSNGTGKDVLLVTDGCVGDKTVSRELIILKIQFRKLEIRIIDDQN